MGHESWRGTKCSSSFQICAQLKQLLLQHLRFPDAAALRSFDKIKHKAALPRFCIAAHCCRLKLGGSRNSFQSVWQTAIKWRIIAASFLEGTQKSVCVWGEREAERKCTFAFCFLQLLQTLLFELLLVMNACARLNGLKRIHSWYFTHKHTKGTDTHCDELPINDTGWRYARRKHTHTRLFSYTVRQYAIMAIFCP